MSSVGKHTQPVSGFSPLNFGGCSLWLDATATSNFALTGSNVTAWYDKSPFSNHATSVSGGSPVLSNTAINGRPGVYFSNAPSIGGPLTLNNTGVAGFILARPLQTGLGRNSDQRIFSAADTGQGDYNSTFRFLVGVQQQQAEIRMYRTGNIIPAGRMNASNTYIISWNYDGTTHSFFLNGVPGEITPTVVNSNLQFSSSRYQLGNQVILTPEVYNGMIGEVIIYNDALLPAQRQAVEGYLAWKWGIAPALGSTFSPLTSLPSCAVWFDGADPSTFTLSESNITQWRDKAGSNVTSNIGTPVYVSNAVGGVPGVRLDVNSGFKISPMSNAANTTTVSIYGVVASSNSAQNNGRIFTAGRVADGQVNNDYNGGGNWTLFRYNTTTTLSFGHTDSYLYGSNTLSNDVPCLISAIFSGTTMTLWTNGSNQGSNSKSSTFTFDRLGIGKNTNPDAGTQFDAWAGSVGEFLIFYAAHTEAQRLQVESYLASKWNIPVRAPLHLVPTHPYTRLTPRLQAFRPTDVPGCVIWMDAADSNSFTFSSGSNISLWRDKSGRGFNFATAQGAPTYASNAVTFAGTTYMRSVSQMTLTGAHYAMIATKLNTGGCMLFAFDTTILAMGGDFSIRYFSDVLNPVNSGDFANPYIVNGISGTIFSSNTYLARHIVEGRSQSSGTTYVTLSSSLANRYFLGDIYEVLLYSSTPSVSSRNQLQAYLAEKWGVRGVMGGPAHPFRYGPPVGATPRSSPAGVAFWLDASDPSTMTLSGSNVTQWRDKAVGYVGSAISNPVYATVDGVPAVTFNGSTQYVNFGDVADLWTAPLNIFVVSKFNSTSDGAIFAKSAFGVAGRYSLLRVSGNLVPLVEGASGAISQPGVGDTNTTRRLLRWTWDRTTNSLFQNGAPTPLVSAGFSDTTTLNTTFLFLVGAYNDGYNGQVPPTSGLYFNGSINEILCIFGALTGTQRQQVEGYLAEKWNLRDSLVPARHRYLSGAPSGFTPASISSCSLWLDAADPSTMTLSGSNVTAWRDKSGRTTLSLTGTSPVYSSNQVRFNSSGRFQGSYTMTTQTTMFLVYSTSNTTTNSRLVTMNGNEYGNIHAPVGPNNDIFLYDGGSTGLFASVTPQTGLRMYTVAFNGTSTALWRNGSGTTLTGTPGAGPPTGTTLTIGAYTTGGEPWNGELSELIFFDTALTTAQRQQVEGYLAAKWGLTASLPVDHPSRSGTPSLLPTAVPGYSLWLDADDASTLTLSGSNVTQWRDKSGNGYHATGTGSTTRQAFNSLQGISIGPGNYFSFSNATALNTTRTLTAFVVASATTPGNFGRLLVFVGATGGGDAQSTSNVVAFQRSDGNQIGYERASLSRGSITYTAPFQFVGSAVFNPSSGIQYINGSSNASGGQTGAFNYFQYWIGRRADGGFEWSGSVCEVLAYNFELSADQRQQVEGYLAAKWGLSATLPVGHPYLSGPQISITPATVGGCILWLDAADPSSYTVSGSNLTAITDKSPFAWPLGTPTNYTVNSTKFNTTYPSFYAPGTGQLGVNSNFALAQPLTVYFAGQATTANSSTFLFDGTTSDRVVIYQGGTMFSGGSEFSATNVGASTSSHVFSAVYNGSSSSMRLNGITTTGTVGTSQFGGIRVSGRNTGGDGYNGHICELVICAGAHTVAQRQQMEGYLSWKWGIPFRLQGPIGNSVALTRALTAEFDPRSVGPCAVWFDAADAGAIQFASGSNIARWLDKSGFQNHLATNSSNQGSWPTYTSNTLNGKPVVSFSGAGMLGPYAPTSPTQPQTMFVVARPSALSGNRVLVQCPTLYDQPQGNLGMAIILPSWASYNWMYSGFYGENNGVSNALTASTTRTDIIAGSWKPSSMTIAVNGTEYGFSSTTPGALGTKALTNSKMVIGGGWYYPENYYRDFYSGYIAEILIFPSFLSSADRQRIEGYLAWKWGLQSQLPALHPYSNASY